MSLFFAELRKVWGGRVFPALLAILAASNLLLLWMGTRPTAKQPPASAYRAVGAEQCEQGDAADGKPPSSVHASLGFSAWCSHSFSLQGSVGLDPGSRVCGPARLGGVRDGWGCATCEMCGGALRTRYAQRTRYLPDFSHVVHISHGGVGSRCWGVVEVLGWG